MRPLREYTRREQLMMKDYLQFPESYEVMAKKHSLIKENENEFKKFVDDQK